MTIWFWGSMVGIRDAFTGTRPMHRIGVSTLPNNLSGDMGTSSNSDVRQSCPYQLTDPIAARTKMKQKTIQRLAEILA